MNTKGFIMIKNDKKIATFNSAFKNGDVELWYCEHCDVYELRYAIRFYASGALIDAVALRQYHATDYIFVCDILTDALELANLSLLERD